MENNERFEINYSGSFIAKNTVYNLLGYGIPLAFAIIIIPFLLKGLGTERFGILNIVWMVIGYFSFFDFGIGRGLTKIIAERVATDQAEQISKIFWTSLYLMLFVSLVIALLISFFIPSIVNIFHISKSMHTETLKTFYLLVLSIPIVSTTAGLRGSSRGLSEIWHNKYNESYYGNIYFPGSFNSVNNHESTILDSCLFNIIKNYNLDFIFIAMF